MGTVESNRKKTITRRNRRQPNRLDLRGELRGHKAEIAVALDTSGSISDEEFKQAIKEVLQIVKNYNHEITIIECDNEIRRTYKVKSVKDIKERINIRGGTKFTPVFEYANKKKLNLLVYSLYVRSIFPAATARQYFRPVHGVALSSVRHLHQRYGYGSPAAYCLWNGLGLDTDNPSGKSAGQCSAEIFREENQNELNQ